MVKDAEANKAEDHRRFELAQARNGLDALVHGVKKSLSEYGDKVGADEKARIESEVKAAEELLKQADATKEALDAKGEALQSAAQKLGEAIYAKTQEAQGGAAGAGGADDAGAAAGAGTGAGKRDEKVVDAEFTEVKDRK
jgi:molecular chaperone DnaK